MILSQDRYCLTINVLGRNPEVDISKEEFENIKQCNAALNAALAVEEKYELITCNYLEYEQDLLNCALAHQLRFSADYTDMFDEITKFNRRITNILTSTRMYMDHMPRHLKRCLPAEDKTEVESFFEMLTHGEYDAYFEYAFLEALRNHLQHAGLCVSQVTLDNRNYPVSDGGRLWENRTLVFTEKKLLDGNPDFKKSVINRMPDKIELTTAIRVYIGCISRIHDKVRDKIQISVDAARASLEEILKKYSDLCASPTKMVHANRYSSAQDSPEEVVLIFFEWDDIRIKLQNKNMTNSNRARHYVSNRTNTTTILPEASDPA
ncbi:hypothetical protein ACIP66_04085 [Pseudomonas sp. NPDC088429]|uniref:hypothetical protein n=1 Tax=Pseudomonas sp. NPDC088429 TaxID=3364455 RepID=UPI00382066C9